MQFFGTNDFAALPDKCIRPFVGHENLRTAQMEAFRTRPALEAKFRTALSAVSEVMNGTAIAKPTQPIKDSTFMDKRSDGLQLLEYDKALYKVLALPPHLRRLPCNSPPVRFAYSRVNRLCTISSRRQLIGSLCMLSVSYDQGKPAAGRRAIRMANGSTI